MQIIYKKTFENQLFHIVNYIAKDMEDLVKEQHSIQTIR